MSKYPHHAQTLTIVLPGDDVTNQIPSMPPPPVGAANSKPLKLGSGLRRMNDSIIATLAGRLQYISNKSTIFVQQNIQRYRPTKEDRVIGIVEERVGSDGAGGDVVRVNINGPHPAVLSNLSFEGATKRNKPQLSPGMLLYARVATTPLHTDPTLSCQIGPNDPGVVRKDWMTNENTYGELRGGTCRKIPLGLARELLHPDNLVLSELAKQGLAFEVAIGVNGYLWVHSTRPQYTTLIHNAIYNSQVLTEAQVRGMVKSLVETVHKQLEEEDDD